jgi:hypothetical protein
MIARLLLADKPEEVLACRFGTAREMLFFAIGKRI